MARIRELEPQELNDHQMRLAKEIGSTRGGGLAVNGPWGLLLRNPQLCERGAAFGTMLRDTTSVPKRLSKLVIAVVARFWTAQFEWHAHAPQAIEAGVSREVIEAIRDRCRPVFDKKDEEAVYEYVSELLETRKASDKTYQALLAQVTQEQAIEITAIAGFYTTLAMLIVAFEVDLPKGAKPQLPA
jgi:4-carboxymuconolactone decarboxylase